METNDATSDDAVLVAYLDGAMGREDRRRFEARLREEAPLRLRLLEMSAGGRPFLQAFDALLAEAPLERLAERLGPARARRQRPDPRLGWLRLGWLRLGWLRPSMVAAGLLAFAAGGAAGWLGERYLPFTAIEEQEEEQETGEGAWRSAVAEYLGLVTSLTLSETGRDARAMEGDFARVGARLNLPLSAGRLLLPGRDIRRLDLYQFEGAPVAQIVYLDPEHGPIAFCILLRKETPRSPAAEHRGDMNIVHWTSGSHAFMVAGLAPEEVLRTAAGLLSKQIS